jgi:hypothetical protein
MGKAVRFRLSCQFTEVQKPILLLLQCLQVCFLALTAGAIGKYLGATTVAGQAALGAGVISAGTQLVVNGKIDPGRLLASAATAGIAETGGFTGSDIAVDAAQLAEQGLSSAQIADI